MAEITVTVVRADTNQPYDVDLPDDRDVGEILPALVTALGLPRVSKEGDLHSYELSNKRTGDSVREGSTLAGRGVKTGDVLLMTSSFVAGGEPYVCPCRQVGILFPDEPKHENAETCRNALYSHIKGSRTLDQILRSCSREAAVLQGEAEDILKLEGEEKTRVHLKILRAEIQRARDLVGAG